MKDKTWSTYHFISLSFAASNCTRSTCPAFCSQSTGPFCPTSRRPLRHMEITGKTHASCVVVARSLLTRIWRRTPKDLTLLCRLRLMLARNEHLQWTLSRKRSYSQITEKFSFLWHFFFWIVLLLQFTKQSGHGNRSVNREKRCTRQVERYFTAISYHVVFGDLMGVTIRIRDKKVYKKRTMQLRRVRVVWKAMGLPP